MTITEGGREGRSVASRASQGEGRVEEERRRPAPLPIIIVAESQLSELQNMRVLLEEARIQARSLAYHRRARLETLIGQALDELERQIEELRAIRG
jgi:hypothetical protein